MASPTPPAVAVAYLVLCFADEFFIIIIFYSFYFLFYPRQKPKYEQNSCRLVKLNKVVRYGATQSVSIIIISTTS